MAVTISESGQFVKVVDGNKTTYVNKFGLSITAHNDTVFIEKPDGSQIKYLYTDVTSPASASALALAATIEGYL